MSRFWIGVVSLNHVEIGVKNGFAQLCHGKGAPLKRMEQGDWLIYYSPKMALGSNEPCQKFTAIGRLQDDLTYQFQMADDFCPYRRDVEYFDCSPAPIRPMLESLSFTKGRRNWGMLFRRGHFEITQADFEMIAEAMGVDLSHIQSEIYA